MSNSIKQTNILLCGSSRVGKSTLINAICQQKLTKTNESLNSITKKIDRYSYEYKHGDTTYETIIWDTPGIESWNEDDVRTYMSTLLEQTQPLCMIYCASPGSFAGLKHLQWLISQCYKRKIFSALVCTNMWSGRNRQQIVDEFSNILMNVHPNVKPIEEDNIIYFDKFALVTMVNSQEYIDQDFGVQKPPSGVEELIFGIAKCLNRDLMFAWFRTVSQNKSFWSKMSSKLGNLLKMPTTAFNSFCENANYFFDALFDTEQFAQDFYMPINHDNTTFTTTTETNTEHLFEDAEFLDIQTNKLLFTCQSDDTHLPAQLTQTLSKLGAKQCQTERVQNDNQKLCVVVAEFEDAEHVEAIHSLWQLATNNQFGCQKIDQ